MSDLEPDNARRGLGRWAVVIPGPLPAEALAALEERRITKQLLAGWDHGVSEPYTMVVVPQASTKADAIGQVQRALEGHGETSGLVATEYVEHA